MNKKSGTSKDAADKLVKGIRYIVCGSRCTVKFLRTVAQSSGAAVL